MSLSFEPAPVPAYPPTLPPRRTETNRGTNASSSAVPTSGAILLVEDHPVNQMLVLAILKKKGYSIDIANDGREVIDRIESAETPYHTVSMDVQMPVLDGLETTRYVGTSSRSLL